MDETHWRQLAAARVEEARCLLAAGHWAGAYYLAGYAVECLLKALAIRQLIANPGLIFSDGNYQGDVLTHDFRRLLRRLDLEVKRGNDCSANRRLEDNWVSVFTWTETLRYKFPDEPTVRLFLDALTDPIDGVLAWIEIQF